MCPLHQDIEEFRRSYAYGGNMQVFYGEFFQAAPGVGKYGTGGCEGNPLGGAGGGWAQQRPGDDPPDVAEEPDDRVNGLSGAESAGSRVFEYVLWVHLYN